MLNTKLSLAVSMLLISCANSQIQSEDIALSPLKDKIAIVQPKLNQKVSSGRNKNNQLITFSLVGINLQTGYKEILTEFEGADIGIKNPKWSPDGKWISFETYSINGHSPLTTFRTWIVDSAGNQLHRVELPEEFNNFSNHPEEWVDNETLEIQGMRQVYESNQWNTIEQNFILNCVSKELIIKTKNTGLLQI